MLDAKLEAAITESVAELSQDSSLARRLVTWITALASGNESLDDAGCRDRHLDALYDAVVVSEGIQEDALSADQEASDEVTD